MPKRRQDPGDLEDLIESLGPSPAPKNLGNLPDDAEPPQVSPPAAASPDPAAAPPPDDTHPADDGVATRSEPEPEADLEEEPPPRAAATDPRLAQLEERLASQQREVEFLRRGQTAVAQPAGPVTPPRLLPFSLRPEDLAMVGLATDERGAQAVQDLLEVVTQVA